MPLDGLSRICSMYICQRPTPIPRATTTRSIGWQREHLAVATEQACWTSAGGLGAPVSRARGASAHEAASTAASTAARRTGMDRGMAGAGGGSALVMERRSRRPEPEQNGDLRRAGVRRLLGVDLAEHARGAARERTEPGTAGQDVSHRAILVDLEADPEIDRRGGVAGARCALVARA